MSNQKTSAAIAEFMDHPAWNDFLSLERQLYEDCLLKALKVDIGDPAYALKVAHANAQAMAMIDLWEKRKTLSNRYKHTKQGEDHADDET